MSNLSSNDITDQTWYWNKVANYTEFTHPLSPDLLKKYFKKEDLILDYGCGYGRIIKQLIDNNFKNVVGIDTSFNLIERGKTEGNLPIYHLNNLNEISIEDNSVDKIVLFAVLTCIPSIEEQQKLISTLYSKLEIGGMLYISDYYIQEILNENNRYGQFGKDDINFGIFKIEEGAVFRHHTKEWMVNLLSKFTILEEKSINVMTLKGNSAKAFQIIAQKEN